MQAALHQGCERPPIGLAQGLPSRPLRGSATANRHSCSPLVQKKSLRSLPSVGQLSRRRGEFIVLRESASSADRITEELRNSDELLLRTDSANGAGPSTAVGSDGASLNGSSLSGSSNGSSKLNGSSPASINGSRNGSANGSANGSVSAATNGAYVFSNGTSSSNGAAAADVLAAAESNGVLNGSVPSANGSAASMNGSAPSSNGASPKVVPAGSKTVVDYQNGATGAAAIVTPAEITPEEVEGYSEACEVGHLDACAAERIAASLDEAAGPEPGPSSTAAAAPAAPAALGSAKRNQYASPGGRWAKFQRYSTFQRTFMIWSFAFVFSIKYFATRMKFTYGRGGMTEQAVSNRRKKLAAWLREGLVKLGPTFVKIGQQFSTRVDVLSKEFVAELEKLQDKVPPFPTSEAIAIVERNLGGSIQDKFDSFEPEPIAAASLGQVHLARLNGEPVVVKVQRPGLKALFDIDLKNIRVLAQWLQKLDPQSDGAARDWVAIYDECSRILYQEIDYRLEAENADRFRKNFANKEWVKVPSINWEYTTSEVLTMEYCPGIKINRAAELDAQGIDRKRLAKLAVECYLEQLLTYGFFHADPHPGNIAVDAVGGGRLIYYDFGMMGSIPRDVRSGLLELFYGVYEKDPDRCISALVTMGVLIPGNDMTAVRRTASFFLKNFEDRLEAQKKEAESNPEYDANFKGSLSKEEKKAKRKAILSAIGEDLLVASADKPFRFPATFTFVVRSFTVLDGIGKSLNPRFDISEIAAPYARGLLLEARPQFAKLAEEFKKRAAKQNRAVKNLFVAPNYIEDVAKTVRQLENGDLKLRVRALEAERALARVQASQKTVTTAILASTLVNVGTVMAVSAMRTAATVSFAGAALFGLQALLGLAKLRKQEKKEAMLSGAV